MTIIDCHCHIYPEKIAARAASSVGDFYNIPMHTLEATSTRLLEICKESPITHHVVCSVATKPATVETINSFIAAECEAHPNFIGFATMHQDYEDPEREINRAIELGLKGLKLHPDTQGVNLDDPRLMNIYEIIEGRIPLMLHTGDYRYDYSHPRRLKEVLKAFPDLVVNAAHFGGWSVYDYAFELLELERCFVDACSSMEYLGPRRTRELVDAYGTDRVMFGSDFPMWSPITELDRIMKLGYDEEDLEKLLYRNCERYLGFTVA
ncbi:MAG: amidohydrolase family protein [Eggerthellaceae bacterium]|nr:amidohydrolase family protein [Eggerthellaceae bacterium]